MLRITLHTFRPSTAASMASSDPIADLKKTAFILGAVLLLGLFIIASFLVPQIATSRKQSAQAYALGNARKIANSLLLYAEEHGVLPSVESYSTGGFAAGLSPLDFKSNPWEIETFALSKALAGKPLPKGADARQVLIFPSKADYPFGVLDPAEALGDEPCFAYATGEAECLPLVKYQNLTK